MLVEGWCGLLVDGDLEGGFKFETAEWWSANGRRIGSWTFLVVVMVPFALGLSWILLLDFTTCGRM